MSSCRSHPCKNGATCVDKSSSFFGYSCDCRPEFFGWDCSGLRDTSETLILLSKLSENHDDKSTEMETNKETETNMKENKRIVSSSSSSSPWFHSFIDCRNGDIIAGQCMCHDGFSGPNCEIKNQEAGYGNLILKEYYQVFNFNFI